MKFLIALLLVAASVQANSLHRYGWTPGKETVFNYESHTLTGIPEINQNQKSGVKLTARVRVQSFSDFSLRIKLENTKYYTFNGDVQMTKSGRLQGQQLGEESHIPEELRKYLEEPFLVHLKSGVVRSFIVGREEPSSVTNIKRALLSQLQMDVSASKRYQLESNHIQLPQVSEQSEEYGNQAVPEYFSTLEESLHGECKTSYTIHKVPEYRIRELEDLWSQEEKKIMGGLESEYSSGPISGLRSEEGKRTCEGKPYWMVTKTRDFENCKVRPIFQKWTGVEGTCDVSRSHCPGMITHLSSSIYYLCGESLKEFNVRKIETENVVKAQPLGYTTEETIKMHTKVILNLEKVKSISERLPIPSEQRELKSIVYQYPTHSQVSEESIKESEEILGVKPVLPQPQLTEAPLTLLPFNMPKEQIKSEIVDQLKKFSQEIYESPESCSSKKDVAGMMTMISTYMRTLSLQELEEVQHQVLSEGKEGLKKLYFEILASVGTNPSTMLLIKKIKNEGVPETRYWAKIIARCIRSVRYPTKEMLHELVQLAKSEQVKSKKELLTTTILNLSNLFYRAYVNPTTMINQFPVKVYGVFGTRESSVLIGEYIPYLIHLVEQQTDNEYVRLTAITALGKIGHFKGLKTILKAIEGKLEGYNWEKDELLRPISVYSLKRLAKINPEKVRPVLLTILNNPVEKPEVRISAISLLPFAKPTPSQLQTLAVRSWYESSKQVTSFIFSTLESLTSTENPELKHLSHTARSVMKLMRPEEFGMQYSKNLHFSSFVEYLKTGVINSFSVLRTKDSMTPLKVTSTAGRLYGREGTLQYKGCSWAVYTQGMDKLIEKYYQYATLSSRTSGTVREQLEKITEMLNIKTREIKMPKVFGLGNGNGIDMSYYYDTETVLEALEKVSRQMEGEKDIEFNTVYAVMHAEASNFGPSDAGFPIMTHVSVPFVMAAKGYLKVTPSESRILPEIDAKIIPVFNSKLMSVTSIVSPFTKEAVGTGVEASVHSSIPVQMKVKVTPEEAKITIKTPEEIERSGRETETLHFFVYPFTFKKSMINLKLISKAGNLKKIVSGEPVSWDIPVGQSLGLHARLSARSNVLYRDLASYLEKIVQNDFSSVGVAAFMPSTVRLSSYRLQYSPSQSETKEFEFKIRWTNKTPEMESRIPSEFKSIRSVLSQISEASEHGSATLLDVTASKKSQYNSKSYKTSVLFGKIVKGNGKVYKTFTAANVQTPSQTTGVRFEGHFNIPLPKYRWNIESVLQENLESTFEGKMVYGSDEHEFRINGKLSKSQELIESIKRSPEYKKCKQEENNGRKMSPVCRLVRKLSGSLDHFEVEIPSVERLRNCPLVSILRGVLESQLWSQTIIHREGSYSGSSLKITGKVDRTSQTAWMKVNAGSEKWEINNLRLNRYTKDILPVPVHIPLTSALMQKATRYHAPETCTIEPRMITTFDNRTYGYELNDCHHLLLKDGSKYMPIAVLARTVQRERKEEGGRKEVKVLSGEIEAQLTPESGSGLRIKINGETFEVQPGTTKTKRGSDGKVVLVVRCFHDNVYELVFPQQQWFKVVTDGYRIEIVAPMLLTGRNVGLCGDMNGEQTADLQSPKRCVMRSKISAVSYILNKSGSGDSSFPSCQGIPSQYKEEYERESQQCLREKYYPTPVYTKLYPELPILSKALVKSHIVDKQGQQTCISKQMVKICQGKPLKVHQKSVEYTCVRRPSVLAMSLEKRALSGENLVPELSSFPTIFRKIEFEPLDCSEEYNQENQEYQGRW